MSSQITSDRMQYVFTQCLAHGQDVTQVNFKVELKLD